MNDTTRLGERSVNTLSGKTSITSIALRAHIIKEDEDGDDLTTCFQYLPIKHLNDTMAASRTQGGEWDQYWFELDLSAQADYYGRRYCDYSWSNPPDVATRIIPSHRLLYATAVTYTLLCKAIMQNQV